MGGGHQILVGRESETRWPILCSLSGRLAGAAKERARQTGAHVGPRAAGLQKGAVGILECRDSRERPAGMRTSSELRWPAWKLVPTTTACDLKRHSGC